MQDLRTMAEIGAEYPGEWVLIGDLVSDENSLEPLAGRVYHHGATREEAYRKAIELRPQRFTVRFTGSISPAGDVWVTPFLPETGGMER
jgi:hypothetical protein